MSCNPAEVFEFIKITAGIEVSCIHEVFRYSLDAFSRPAFKGLAALVDY
jgi:hypothetical protein